MPVVAGRLTARLRDYALLMRVDRPIGIFLLLWPTLWGLWLAADGRPDERVFAVFVLGVFLMRSAGCAINDFADREFDPHVKRTRERPLAARRIRPREALVIAILLGLLSFGLVLTTNALTIRLSMFGAFLAISYPFVKRLTSLPQLYLGLAFSWGIPMAFAAQTGGVAPLAWWLVAANLFWVVAYDTAYAMVDRQDDLRIGVRSTAILFGRFDRVAIAACQLLMILLMTQVGRLAGLGHWYFSGLFAAAGFMVYQQWLIRAREPDLCFRAFLNNNWTGLSIFAGLALDYALVSGAS